MWKILITTLLFTFLGLISKSVEGMQCYECNVWRAGYGVNCDQPRVVGGCTACMKVETISYIGYYKNTPRKSVVVSKICATAKVLPFHNECLLYSSSDGTSERCYCDQDLCNDARKLTVSFPVLVGLLSSLFMLLVRS